METEYMIGKEWKNGTPIFYLFGKTIEREEIEGKKYRIKVSIISMRQKEIETLSNINWQELDKLSKELRKLKREIKKETTEEIREVLPKVIETIEKILDAFDLENVNIGMTYLEEILTESIEPFQKKDTLEIYVNVWPRS